MAAKDEELLVALRRIIRAIDLRSKQLSKQYGLTGPQLFVMQQIAKAPGIMVREIAENINLSPATVTNILDRLEIKALALRVRSQEDKRKVGVYLSEQGKSVIQNSPTHFQDEFTDRFNRLEDWEQSLMVSTLQRLAGMMGAQELDASPVLEVDSLERSFK